MPEPTEADAAARAAAIESELQTSIDEAKADVANETRSEDEKRAAQERLNALEARMNSVEAQKTNASPVVETPPIAPSTDDDRIGRLESKLDEIAAAVRKPVETARDVAAAVAEPVTDAAENAAKVVESVPVRTHAMFRKVIGGGRDG